MNVHALVLISLLFVAHWVADYTHMSTPWMLAAKRFGKPVLPILAHAGWHALLTAGLVILFTDFVHGLIAGLFMLVTHAAIDTLKGRLNGWFPGLQNPANPYHWYVFGADQTLHAWVLIGIAFYTTNGF